jgi:hypothetical protein
MNCPRCGASLRDAATECSSCGLPSVFMGGDDRVATRDEVLEPEVLASLDDVDGPGPGPGAGPRVQVRPLGCTLGPGCGCVALPLLALAGVFVSLLIALLWVLNLGRLPASLAGLAARARRGFSRS